jgi:hypothetical protein
MLNKTQPLTSKTSELYANKVRKVKGYIVLSRNLLIISVLSDLLKIHLADITQRPKAESVRNSDMFRKPPRSGSFVSYT